MTMAQFIAAHGVKFSATMTDKNPNMDDMPSGSAHWKCQIRRGRRSMTVHFSQGPAVCREPTAADVLDCLASDAAGYENARSFEDWCGEYGYDTDSRKAERTFRAVEAQSTALARLLSPDEFNALLFKVERL
jgi:hypothetical protein